MRLLVITNMYPRPEQPYFGSFVAEQLASLKAAGVAADLYFIEGYRDKLAYFRAARGLRKRRADYDCFHAHHAYSALAALVAGCRPLVLTIHDNPIVTSPTYRAFARWVARRADRFVAVSAASAHAVAPPNAAHIPMGIDLQLFYPRDRQQCRRELGLALGPKYVLFPADPARYSKRVDLARAAVTLAKETEPTLELLQMPFVERDQVPVYFNAADVILVTSDVELGPLTVKEAIASGRPAVSRRVGDVEFLDKCTGCVPVGDTAEEIAAGLLQALHSPEVNPQDVEPYAAAAVASRLVSLYNELVGGPRS